MAGRRLISELRERSARGKARRSRPSPLSVAAVAGAAVACAGAASLVGAPSSAAPRERTVTAQQGVVQSTVSGSGNLSPANQLSLSFGTSGKVTRVEVKAGEHVSRGDLLARLDPTSALVTLAEAKATLQSAQDTLDGVQSGSTTATASTSTVAPRYVAVVAQAPAADPATGATPPSTTTAPRTTTAPQATTTPQTTTTPQATTTPQTSATPKTTTTTPKTTTTTPATKSSAARTASSSSGGSSAGGGSSSSSPGAGGASSTTTLASAQAAVKSALLAVRDAENAVAATRLRAPVAGTIAMISGAVGDSVGSSSSSSGGASSDAAAGAAAAGGSSSSGFMTLVQLSRYTMQVSLSESDIAKVKVGQRATVTVNAAASSQFAAHVRSIDVLSSSSASSTSSAVSYPVTLSLDQTGKKLKAGMSASADIVVAQASGIVVPTQALQGSSVTVVKDGVRSTRQVRAGVAGDASTQILSGLRAGETLIVRSQIAPATTPASGQSTGVATDRLGGPGGGVVRRFGGGGGGGGGIPGGAKPGAGGP